MPIAQYIFVAGNRTIEEWRGSNLEYVIVILRSGRGMEIVDEKIG